MHRAANIMMTNRPSLELDIIYVDTSWFASKLIGLVTMEKSIP